MKIFLFGGAEGQVEIELKLIEKIINDSGANQVLLIPFARIQSEKTKEEWRGDWFHRYMQLPGVEYLNAENEGDIAKARSPLIFISGGSESARLAKKIKSNPRLLTLIKSSSIIIGESAGAKVLGEFLRAKEGGGPYQIISGLGIIKDTIIEPHFTATKREAILVDELKTTKVRYGIGIDSLTGMEFELDEFPEKYKTIGVGSVKIVTNNSFL